MMLNRRRIAMKTYNESDNINDETIQIALPKQTVEDLKLIALFYECSVDELVANYIAKSIADDSKKARRVEFEKQRCSNNPSKKCRANIAEEIWNNSNLMY